MRTDRRWRQRTVVSPWLVRRGFHNSRWSLYKVHNMGHLHGSLNVFETFIFGGHMCPILGPLVSLFWISSYVSSGFQSQSGLHYLYCRGKHNVHSLRSTSGATHANLLAASLPPVLSPVLLQRWGCQDSNSCSQNICRSRSKSDILPTELNQELAMC